MRFRGFLLLWFACIGCTVASRASATHLVLDSLNTDVTIQITLAPIPQTDPPQVADVLNPTVQSIPISSGYLDFDDNGTDLSNLSGELFIDSPWLIPTFLGQKLSVAGGHLSIGPAPNGPFPVTGSDVDVGGLGLVLDGGANTVLFEFDFGAEPVSFVVPAATFAAWDGNSFVLPTVVSGSTEIELFGNPLLLSYIIGGQVAFVVPEPGTFALAGIGLVGLIPLVRRRQRAKRAGVV
jgi:hypothetical protein